MLKWLLSRLRDPSLLPLSVRTFIAVVFVISGFGIILSNADKLHKIAAMGLSFGVVGAGILYYETVVTDEVLIIIGRQIVDLGRSKNLSTPENFPGHISVFGNGHPLFINPS